jgi:hypothetical protein
VLDDDDDDDVNVFLVAAISMAVMCDDGISHGCFYDLDEETVTTTTTGKSMEFSIIPGPSFGCVYDCYYYDCV